MNKELAKTLTTALVQFIDRERPGWSMCCSNAECEAIENAFREDNFFYVETLVERKFSRLTEFEKGLINFYNKRNEIPSDKDGVYNKHDLEEFLHESAKTLLALAREQFIKDGYVIEKKAFHDAVEKVDPEVMKEVSENVDKANEEKPTEFEKFMDKVVDDAIRETYSKDGFYDICRDALALAKKELLINEWSKVLSEEVKTACTNKCYSSSDFDKFLDFSDK